MLKASFNDMKMVHKLHKMQIKVIEPPGPGVELETSRDPKKILIK